jgi:hypothetical protein
MPVPKHLLAVGLPPAKVTGSLNQHRLQGPSAGRQTAMPKRQRPEYTRCAPVHLFHGTPRWPALPVLAPRLGTHGLLHAHNVQFFSRSTDDTLKPDDCTMCMEFNLSELFCNCWQNKDLQNDFSKRAPVSRGRRFRVWVLARPPADATHVVWHGYGRWPFTGQTRALIRVTKHGSGLATASPWRAGQTAARTRATPQASSLAL